MNKSLKRVIVSAMALSLLVPAVLAPKAEAAAKPKLSAKSVKVIVGAKKKVTVKKVKAKKIKKTTWSLPKKGKKIVVKQMGQDGSSGNQAVSRSVLSGICGADVFLYYAVFSPYDYCTVSAFGISGYFAGLFGRVDCRICSAEYG